MKHYKRLLSVVLCVVTLLVGCSAPAGKASLLNKKKPITLTLWHYYVGKNQNALDSAIDNFNQTLGMENGVIVSPVPMNSISELETHISNSVIGVVNALPMPDMFSSYPDKAMQIDSMGFLADLNNYFTAEEKSLFVPTFLNDGAFSEGRLLLVPIVKSTELLYVNATAWNEYTAATGNSHNSLATWESLYEAAQGYFEWTDSQTPDILWDGKTLLGFDSLANFIIIANKQMGLDVISSDGENTGHAVLNRQTLRRLFDMYYKGMTLGYFGATGKFRSDDIKMGKLAAYVGSSSGAAYFPTWIEMDNKQSPIDFLALPYPVFSGGTPYAIQQGAGMCVTRNEKDPAREEGSALFLKWFVAEDVNIEFAMTTGYLPVQTGAYTSDTFNTALSALRANDGVSTNVATVYEIALHQILEADTYAATPFEGSYDIRKTMQDTLTLLVEQGLLQTEPLKQQNLSPEEILTALDLDARFDEWLQLVRTELDTKNIAHTN